MIYRQENAAWDLRQMILEVGSKNDMNDTDDGVDATLGWLLRIDRCCSTHRSTQSHPPASRKKTVPMAQKLTAVLGYIMSIAHKNTRRSRRQEMKN